MAIVFGSALLDVNDVVRDTVAASRRVCRFVMDESATNFATGVLVGPDVVLTAAHVFFHRDGTPIAERMQERVTIEFADGGPMRMHEKWLLSPGVDERAHASRDIDRLDFAMIRLETAADASRGWCEIPAPENAPILVPQTMLRIVQFVDRGSPRISLGTVLDISYDRMRVHYTASALPAASGAPVFDDQFRLAALHVARGENGEQGYNAGLPVRRVAMACAAEAIA